MISIDQAIYISGLVLWLFLIGCGLSIFVDKVMEKIASAIWPKKEMMRFIFYRIEKRRRRSALMRRRDE